MSEYIHLFLGSHLLLLKTVLIVYIFELITGLKIIVGWFLYKKDLKSAQGTAIVEPIIYFLYNFVYAIIEINRRKDAIQSDVNLLIWSIIILFFSYLINRFYIKFQGVDTSKPDFGGWFTKK